MSGVFKVSAIILAAGSSQRMGKENKLLKIWNGRPLIEHVCFEATNSQCNDVVLVTGHQKELVAGAIDKYKLVITNNKQYETGVSSSIKLGIKVAVKLNSDAVLVLLGDMPQITSKMMENVIRTAKNHPIDSIIISTCNGKRGNPVLWPACYFKQLLTLEGDEGARQIMQAHKDKIVTVELGFAARFDLDTPEAFK